MIEQFPPPKNTLQSQLKKGFSHQKTQTSSRHCHLEFGKRQPRWSKLAGLTFLLVQANPNCTSSKNPILFFFFSQARLRFFQLFHWHFSRAPFRIWRMVKHFLFFTLNMPQLKEAHVQQVLNAQAVSVCHRWDILYRYLNQAMPVIKIITNYHPWHQGVAKRTSDQRKEPWNYLKILKCCVEMLLVCVGKEFLNWYAQQTNINKLW